MEILPDVLQPGVKVVFCGTAAGERSAALGAYYAGRGNQFWTVLHRVGLTPRQLEPQEFQSLLKFGIGLTDLAKCVCGNDSTLSKEFFDIDGLRQRIGKINPKAVAFNGKNAAKNFLCRSVRYGRQCEKIGTSVIFVLPSTSGAARRYWNEQYWLELADFLEK